MAKADYYQLSGVGKTASQDELKKAYRKLAMKYHPDRNPDDAAAEAKFKEVTEAYEILKDDQRRAAYDQFGHAAFEQGGGGGDVALPAALISARSDGLTISSGISVVAVVADVARVAVPTCAQYEHRRCL